MLLPLIDQYRVTIVAAVPTVYRQILKYTDPSQHNLSELRHVLCAGEPLSPALRDEWTSQVGAPMYESLGMTEISTYISNGPAVPIVQGSPGKPQAGRTVAILDADSDSAEPLPPGELGLLAVHRTDPGLMLGYWQRPEEETHVYRGDWFTGGDLAIMDKGIHLVQRTGRRHYQVFWISSVASRDRAHDIEASRRKRGCGHRPTYR